MSETKKKPRLVNNKHVEFESHDYYRLSLLSTLSNFSRPLRMINCTCLFLAIIPNTILSYSLDLLSKFSCDFECIFWLFLFQLSIRKSYQNGFTNLFRL